MFATRTGEGLGFNQVIGQSAGLPPVAGDFAQVRRLPVAKPFGTGCCNPSAHSRIGPLAMDQGLQFRFRRSARLVTARRHHRITIPGRDGREMLVAVDAGAGLGEGGVSAHGRLLAASSRSAIFGSGFQ